MSLVSRVPSAPQAPNRTKHVDWGTAIAGVYNIQQQFQQLGTNGTFLQLQNKQAITCGIMSLDNNGNIPKHNRDLMHKILPHRD